MNVDTSQHKETPVPALVVVGELNVDLILEQVNALPALDVERRAQSMTLTLGSSSAILAANASALNCAVGFVGLVGADVYGAFVTEALARRQVDTRHVRERPDRKTGLTAVFTTGAQRGAITYPGAMEALTLADIPWKYLARAQHLHLSSYYLQRGLRPDVPRLFEEAKARGLSTSFDTNWDPDEQWGEDVWAVLPHVDVFLPNDEEARRLSGEIELDASLRRLAEPGCTVVITCGPDGARAYDGEREHRVEAVPVTPVDAIGAGDSFNAGFLTRYLEGAPLDVCLQAGAIAGAFSTLRAGGTAAFDDMDRFAQFAGAHAPSVSH